MMPVLDHGYVKCITSWGSDEMIIESARMSTAKGFQGWGNVENPGDERLLAYLWKHKHATPFEMAGIIIEVKAPIFVFREWHRHRTQGYSEMSARYVPLPDENYVPSKERIINGANSAANNRQAQGTVELHPDKIQKWLDYLEDSQRQAEMVYQMGLEFGIPKELARLAVPVARYSKMRATANLRNWLAFLELRIAPTAQWEIRQYAEAVGHIVNHYFPRTWALFKEGK